MIARVFCRSDAHLPVAAIVGELFARGFKPVPHFKGDDLGWTGGTLILPGNGSAIQVDRFLTDEDELRPDLNRFAAELETLDYSPNHRPLMEWVIQTRQMVAFRRPIDHADEATLDRFCDALAQFVAAKLDGVYQMDGRGWYAADGTLMLEEY